MARIRASSDSGELIVDRLPVPKQRESGPRLPSAAPGAARSKRLALIIGGSALAAAIAGFLVRPYLAPDGRLSDYAARAAVAELATAEQQKKTADVEAQLAAAKSTTRSIEAKLEIAEAAQAELAAKATDAAKKLKDAQGVQTKLAPALEKGVVTATIVGDEVHIAIPDKVLFKAADDQLTDKGAKVLAKLASVLKTELPDRHIAVQGHTDDTPPPPAPKAPTPPAPKKGKAPAPPPPAPVARFRTNWELSSARALSIIHYFQDVAKLDGARLSALAFSQYRPASTTVKAQNRRLVLVLTPRPAR